MDFTRGVSATLSFSVLDVIRELERLGVEPEDDD